MLRLLKTVLPASVMIAASAQGQDNSSTQQALALQQTVRSAIARAEPSIACILISRSDVYRRYFRDEPPADNPGRLGSFIPGRKALHPSFQDEFSPANEDGSRYDLANPNYVPESYGSGIAIE